MNKFKILFIVLFLVVSSLFAQVNLTAYKEITKLFNSFQYDQVIAKSQELVQKPDLTPSLLIELFRMKAIAHYSLNQKDLTVLSFVEILKIQADHVLDPRQNSPKLIDLFNKTKSNYKPTPIQPSKLDTLTKPRNDLSLRKEWQSAFLRSIALPGWGHLYSSEHKSGWLLSCVSIISLGSSLYFTIQTENLEHRYLNETNTSKIERRYSAYNRSYQWRNTLLVGYFLIWTYSQFDLSKDLFRKSTPMVSGQLNADLFSVSYSISF